jgi:hypothetical protein
MKLLLRLHVLNLYFLRTWRLNSSNLIDRLRVGRPEFDSQEGQSAELGPGVHTASCRMSTVGLSPGLERPGHKAHFHLVLRTGIVKLYLHSSLLLHDIMVT